MITTADYIDTYYHSTASYTNATTCSSTDGSDIRRWHDDETLWAYYYDTQTVSNEESYQEEAPPVIEPIKLPPLKFFMNRLPKTKPVLMVNNNWKCRTQRLQ